MKNFTKTILSIFLCIGTLIANAQVPKLSSLPTASSAIFLDFDGHTVAGTSWNVSGPIECGASGLNDAQITEIFNRIAEDYRPFNINVTTDSTKYWSAPATKRMRVIFTVTSSWYGNSGGVAFTNSFTWGDNTPCFVFSALLNNNIKFISEAGAHEAGHTLGLRHQSAYDANCVKTSDYNYGAGAGEIGWAPIMGVGYYQNLSQWHNGPNSTGCTSTQDDLSVISGNTNGFGYRADDHQNTITTATTAPFSNNQFTINGIIEKPADQDLFKYSMTQSGRFQLSAIPYSVGAGNAGSDLDLQVSLLNGSQTVIGVYNPGTLLNSFIDSTLNIGTYYLRVEGRGNTFSSGYASLGSYALQANYVSENPTTPPADTTTAPAPTITLDAVIAKTKHNLSWKISSTQVISKLVIELSSDGIIYNKLAETLTSATSYSYTSSANIAYYRLNVTFANLTQAYSNIAKVETLIKVTKGVGPSRTPATTASFPELITNMINSNSLKINSPRKFNYSVMDLNGRSINHGPLTIGANSITVNNLINGIYLIRYTDGHEQWTEKFVKQ